MQQCILIFMVSMVLTQRDPNIIDEEISQLEYLIQLQQEKLHYLKELRVTALNTSSISKEMLEQVVKNKPYQATQMSKSQQSLERTFTNRLLKKSQYNFTSIVQESTIITTFQYRTQSDSTSTQMLVVLNNNTTLELYDLAGGFITSQELTFQPDLILTSGRQDDPIVGLVTSAGQIAIIRVDNAKQVTEVQGEQGQKTKTKFVVQLTLEMNYQIEGLSQITASCFATIKGNKYLVFGDVDGSMRNGTHTGNKQIVNSAIRGISRSYPHLLYQSDNSFGFFNPIAIEIAQPNCDNLPFQIQHVTGDLVQNNIVYVLSQDGEIYVFEMRSNENCKMRHKLVADTGLNVSQSKLISLRSYLLMLDQISKKVQVFNTTEALNDDQFGIESPIGVEYFTQSQGDTIVMQAIKGNGASHYLLVSEHIDNHTQLSYYEVVMPTKKDVDFFTNMRFPIIIIAIVLILVYQFWCKGKSTSTSKKHHMNDEMEVEQLLKGASSKGQVSPTPIQQQKATKYNDDLRKLDRFRDQLDTIDYKTKQLNSQVGVSSQGDNKQKMAGSLLQQNKKYI